MAIADTEASSSPNSSLGTSSGRRAMWQDGGGATQGAALSPLQAAPVGLGPAQCLPWGTRTLVTDDVLGSTNGGSGEAVRVGGGALLGGGGAHVVRGNALCNSGASTSTSTSSSTLASGLTARAAALLPGPADAEPVDDVAMRKLRAQKREE